LRGKKKKKPAFNEYNLIPPGMVKMWKIGKKVVA
jgi:hypothetical protein